MVKTVEEFDAELARAHMRGQWQYDELLVRVIGGPKPAGVPYVWKWRDVYPRLVEACEVIAESYTARRNISFVNPGLERGGTTHTLLMGMQMIKPGEVAWAHRHTIAALRFVVRGDARAYTAVDGEACPMEDYDLILTPQWTWHDHVNPSSEHVVWVDVLDLGLVLALNVPFYETYGEACQPERGSRGEYVQERAAVVRPVWERPKRWNFPFRYAWRDVEPVLRRMADQGGSPYDGVVLEYVNPMTGGSTFPTMSCWIQWLRPGQQTEAHRHTSSAVYFVVRGEGKTIVGDQELEWEQHDCFVIPNWMWHRHVNRSRQQEAILFSVNDIPVLQALGLYREEPEISLHCVDPPAVPADVARRKE
jgi:1-hydroxy-2-naphthoate dioxygenase